MNFKLSKLLQFKNIVWTANHHFRITQSKGDLKLKTELICQNSGKLVNKLKNLVIDWTIRNSSAATTASGGRAGATSSSSLTGALHFFRFQLSSFADSNQFTALEYGPSWASHVLPFFWTGTRLWAIGPLWYFSYKNTMIYDFWRDNMEFSTCFDLWVHQS